MDIVGWLRKRWNDYQDNKKWQEFYAKLDRNKEGKFTKSQYIRNINQIQKEKRKQK